MVNKIYFVFFTLLFSLNYPLLLTARPTLEFAHLVEQGPRGESIWLDFGKFDFLNEGDVVKLYAIRGENDPPRYLTQATLIKLMPSRSLWQLNLFSKKKTFNEKLFVGQRLLLSLISNKEAHRRVMNFRRFIKVRQHIYPHSDENELPKDFVASKVELDHVDPQLDFVAMGEGDFEELEGKTIIYRIQRLIDPLDEDQFYNRLWGQKRHSRLVTYLQRLSDNKKFQEKFHVEKERGNRERKDLVDFLEKRGVRFSEQMDDKELIRFVRAHGAEVESQRWRRALDGSADNQIYFLYGIPKTDHFSFASRKETFSSFPYQMALGYEYFGANFSHSLDHLSLDLKILKSNRFLKLTNKELSLMQYSMGIGFRFYLFSPPTNVNEPLVYLGMGMSFGQAHHKVISTTGRDLNAKAKYDFYTMPEFSLGYAYRFSTDLGFTVGADYVFGKYSNQSKQYVISNDYYSEYFQLVFSLGYYF